MNEIHPDLWARISAIEAKLDHLYAHLGLVEPGLADAVADGLSTSVQALARSGDRDAAIRQVMVEEGVSAVVARARVDAFLRSLGR